MYSLFDTLFNSKLTRTAQRIQRLEYKYETVEYVKQLILSGKL